MYDGFNITINGSNKFSGNSATHGRRGVIYKDTAVISGSNAFTNNTAGTRGGAIEAFHVTFKGNGSSAVFTGNTANGVKNDLTITGFSSESGSVTIQDTGTYVFNGGITAATTNSGNYNLKIKDGADVTFGEGSVTKVTGNVSLKNASLTIVGGTDTTFKAADWDTTNAGSSQLQLVHKANQYGKVIDGNAEGLLKIESAITVQLTGDAAANQFGYVSRIDHTGVVTDVKTGTGAFNLVRKIESSSSIQSINAFLGSSATLSGSYGANTVQSGDAIVVTADGKSGGALNFDSNTTLTIYSNVSGTNRTIDAEGNGQFFNVTYGDLTLHSQNITYKNGTTPGNIGDSSYGGAIYARGNVTLSGSNTFTENSANSAGGAIYTSIGTVVLSGKNLFNENSAKTDGGAICAQGNVTLSDSNTFTKNSVNGDGGAIITNSSITLSGNNEFTENSAKKSGGAI